jgi:hypothetical protein
MIYWIIFGVLILLAVIVYAAAIINTAKQHVNTAPRDDMFLCDIHGPIPGKSTYVLFDGQEMEQVSEDGRTIRALVRQCPICFEAKIKEARTKND